MCRRDDRQPAGLIRVLLDREAEFGDRHDAAMDLANYDGEDVENALERVIFDQTENPDLIKECEETLMEVRDRKK